MFVTNILIHHRDLPTIAVMTSILFLVFLALIAVGLSAVIASRVSRRTLGYIVGGLGLWFLYIGVLGYFGIIRNITMRPPGAAFLFFPVAVFLGIFIARAKNITSFPLWLLIAAQSFRFIVELFIHQLWIEGLVPKMLTFSGANIDIYIGISAIPVAWISTRGNSGKTLALIWNIAGLLALANVVIRAVLTAPGPLHLIRTEVPNAMIGTFPLLFIPAFFVPLAVVLHTLALRMVLSKNQGAMIP